jgi:hypothetical protein
MTKRAPISQKNTATVKDNIDSATNTANNCLGAKLQLRASFQCRRTDNGPADENGALDSNADSSAEAPDHDDEVPTDMLRYCFQHCFNIARCSGDSRAF